MKQLRIYPSSINERFIEEAVASLREGNLIIYPTDTVYAIGCDALNNNAIEQICALKGVDPRKQTLSVVCADISQASAYARIDNRAFALLRQYTPGAVTFILPASTSLPKVFKGQEERGCARAGQSYCRGSCRGFGQSAPLHVDQHIRW